MIVLNRILRQLNNFKSLRTNFDQQCYRNTRCVSSIKDLNPKEFRKKTEHSPFFAVQNNDDYADTFGTLANNVETNEKLNSLPPEDDDVIQYNKDEQSKRLHITEYHKMIQNLIKQQKVGI